MWKYRRYGCWPSYFPRLDIECRPRTNEVIGEGAVLASTAEHTYVLDLQSESVWNAEDKSLPCFVGICMNQSHRPCMEDPFKCAGSARGCGCVNAGGGGLCSAPESATCHSATPCLMGSGRLKPANGSGAGIKFRGCQSQLPSFSQLNKQSLVTTAICKSDRQHLRKQLFSCSTQFLVFSIPKPSLFVPPHRPKCLSQPSPTSPSRPTT